MSANPVILHGIFRRMNSCLSLILFSSTRHREVVFSVRSCIQCKTKCCRLCSFDLGQNVFCSPVIDLAFVAQSKHFSLTITHVDLVWWNGSQQRTGVPCSALPFSVSRKYCLFPCQDLMLLLSGIVSNGSLHDGKRRIRPFLPHGTTIKRKQTQIVPVTGLRPLHEQ